MVLWPWWTYSFTYIHMVGRRAAAEYYVLKQTQSSPKRKLYIPCGVYSYASPSQMLQPILSEYFYHRFEMHFVWCRWCHMLNKWKGRLQSKFWFECLVCLRLFPFLAKMKEGAVINSISLNLLMKWFRPNYLATASKWTLMSNLTSDLESVTYMSPQSSCL